MTQMQLASMIDHTLLKADVSPQEIKKICHEAQQYQFASVCVNPMYVPLASRILKQSDVKVCTVVGFPLGATTTAIKVSEALDAIGKGADEIDMVMPIGLLRANMLEECRYDIEQAVLASHSQGALVKVILEICYLTDDEIKIISEICLEAGADFIKTSTGFGTSGATIERVKLMKSLCGNIMKVKASGGIRTYDDALNMIEAGADRLGTSNSIAIMEKTHSVDSMY